MKKKRNLWIAISTAICSICALFSCALLPKQVAKASAQDSQSSFEMLGASIRTAETDGIRFIAQIDGDEWDSYGENVRYGMMLIPQDMEKGVDFTLTYADGQYTPDSKDVLVIEGGALWNDEVRARYNIADGNEAFSCALIANQGDGTEAVRFPSQFYNRAITAVAFIIPENGDVIYTQKLTRSLGYVALLESLKEDYQENPFVEDIIDEVSVELSLDSEMIYNGQQALPDLKIGGLDALASSLVSVEYSSNDTSVAKIENGKVVGVSKGVATITATISVGGVPKLTATTEITVAQTTREVVVSAGVGGTVTGGGTYDEGQSVTVVATANAHYTFDGWYENGELVSTDAQYTFVLDSDTTLEAKFSVKSYQIYTDREPAAGGEVSGAGTYNYGSQVTLTATTNVGYVFKGWYVRPNLYSKDETITVTAEQNIIYTAKWDKASYRVKLTMSHDDAGSVTGDKYYYYGDTATVTATTEATWRVFDGWYLGDELISSDATYSFVVTGGITLQAKWKGAMFSLFGIADPKEGGVITGNGLYEYETKGALTATPNVGYTFDGWYDGTFKMTSSNTYRPEVLGNKSYTAKFARVLQKVTISSNHYYAGIVTGGGNYGYGDVVTLKSYPDEGGGYSFEGWYDENGEKLSGEPEYTFTMGLEPRSFRAKWYVHIYFDLNGGEGETPAMQKLNVDDSVVQPPDPTRTGYTFSHWSQVSPKDEVFDFSWEIAFSGTLYANWVINQYDITAVTEDAAKGTVTGSGTQDYDSSITLTATPKTGYNFDGWYDGTKKVSSDATWTFNVPAENKTYTAKFTIKSYTISVSSESTSKGTVTGGGTYDHFATAEVKATRKTGYAFAGWYEGDTKVSSSSTYSFEVTGARTLVAKWSVKNVTVTFNTDGGSAVSSQTIQEGKTPTKPADPTKTGYTFAGWDYNFTDAITSNKTINASWTINTYTVTFNSKGGSSVTAKTTNYNTAISAPTAPTKTGYTFSHWSKTDGGAAYDFSSKVTGDFTLYAVWTINTYTVTFNSKGGSSVTAKTTNYNTAITAPTAPTKTGYTFSHWSKTDGGAAYDFSSKVTGDFTLYAVWTINTYTVSFNVNGGSGSVASQSVNYNSTATKPTTNPTRTGYTFQYWSTSSSGSEYDFSTKITGNKTLYAIWKINTYTVSFNVNGGSGSVASQSINYNSTATKPTTNPTRTGYTFQYWSTSSSGSEYDFSTKITGNKTLYAIWKINTYTVSFNVNGGSGSVASQSVDYNSTASKPTTNPTRTGYTFQYWSTSSSGSEYDFSTKITGNKTLYAIWKINTYTVSFNVNGGSGSVASQSVNYNSTATKPTTNPTRTGYTFQYWSTSTSGSEYDFSTKITGNKTLYAIWKINTYTVSFNVNGGSGSVASQSINYNSTATKPTTNPTRTGYTFQYWSTSSSGSEYDFSTKITGNKTLYAIWKVNTYKVTVSAATIGGSVSGSNTYNYGSTATLKATPDSGYSFVGWYNESGDKVETAKTYSVTVKKAITLKAKFKATVATDTWKDTNGYNYFYYTQLGSDVMPIGAWSSPPPNTSVTVNGVKKTFSTNQITQANYNTIKDSGINAIYGLYDSVWSNDNNSTRENWVKNALNYAQNAGMVYVVRDGNAYTALSDKGNSAWSQFEYYMNHPAYGGTLFVDEPGYDQFDEIGNAMKLWNAHEVYGDNKLALVNNLPNYSSAAQLYYGIGTSLTTAPTNYTGKNFENWVRAYLEMTQAKVYSYDFYPYSLYGNNYMKDENGYGFFDNISAVRKVCTEKNVPFWTFNQSGAAFGNTRLLTQAEVAMQVNLSLAYGAKGIQWFNYWQPLECGSGENDICALIDHNGNKTRYYNMVKKVNTHVAAVDSFLMKSKSTGIIEIGSSILGAVPDGDKVTKYGALTSASGIGNAIVGCFEYRDKGYVYYVASSDFTEDAVVNLNFNGVYNIQRIKDAASHWYDTNSVTVHVPAGEGVLFYVPKTAQSATTCKLTVNNDNTSAGSAYGAGTYKVGSIVTIAAQAKPGYKFLGWYSGNSIFTSEPVFDFTASSNMTLTAYWQEDTSPAMLNDCEQNKGWATDQHGNELPLSTAHVTQGTYSAKATGAIKLRLGYHPLTLAELKSTYKAIRIHIYLDSSSWTTILSHDWTKAFCDLAPGSNYAIIKTADLTDSHYRIENGSGILSVTLAAGTGYIDNIVGLKSTVMLNDCETIDGVQTSVTPTLSATNKVQGSYSVAATCTVPGWWLNLRVAEPSVSLAEFQATYSTVTFHVYSSFAGEVIGSNQNTLWLYDLSTGAWGKNLAIFTNGTLHSVTINTADLTSSMYVTDAWGSYICMSVGGASTIWIDNVCGTLK